MTGWRGVLKRASVAVLLAVFSLGWVMVANADDAPRDIAAPGALASAAPVQTAAAPSPPKPDPSGAATGGIADITAKTPGKPTLEEVAETVGHNKISINIMWTLVAGFLVMFMQAGFALAETGFTRAKNAAHTMMMNLMVYGLGILGFWAVGYALQMGGSGSAMGAAVSAPEGMSKLVGPTIHGNVWGLFGG